MKERFLRTLLLLLMMNLFLPGSLLATKLKEFNQTTLNAIDNPMLKIIYRAATEGKIGKVSLGDKKEIVLALIGHPTFEENRKNLTVLFYADKGLTFGFKKEKLIHISFWNFYNDKEINLNFSDIEAILGISPKHQYSNNERRIRFFGNPSVEGFVLGYLPKKDMEELNTEISFNIVNPAFSQWRTKQLLNRMGF